MVHPRFQLANAQQPRVASLKSGGRVPMGSSTILGHSGAVCLPIPSGWVTGSFNRTFTCTGPPAGPSSQTRGHIHHQHLPSLPLHLSQGIVKNALLIDGLICRILPAVSLGRSAVKAIKLMWPLAASVMAGHKVTHRRAGCGHHQYGLFGGFGNAQGHVPHGPLIHKGQQFNVGLLQQVHQLGGP